jgi:hypothetical protein
MQPLLGNDLCKIIWRVGWLFGKAENFFIATAGGSCSSDRVYDFTALPKNRAIRKKVERKIERHSWVEEHSELRNEGGGPD